MWCCGSFSAACKCAVNMTSIEHCDLLQICWINVNPLLKERWRSCLECPFCIDISSNLYSITPFSFMHVFFSLFVVLGLWCVFVVVWFFLEQCLPNELQGPELTFLSFPYLWRQDQLKLHLLDLSRTCLAPLSDRSSPWEHSDLQPGAVNELRSRQVRRKWSDLMYIFLTLHCLPGSASCAGKLLRELIQVSYHSLTFWVK